MRINAGQVGQIVLSTLQGAKELEGKLELKVGSVVRATLMQQAGKDEVWLQIGGKNVRARLDANVKPGDQVDLLVTGEQKQGAMELKVVGQPIKSGESGKQLDIAGLVRALGLPETEETKALVQELASRGVPLKQETVRAALAVLRNLPQVTPAHITTLGKMAELGIPILPSTFEAMHTLEAGPKLHDLLTKIQTALQGLFPESARPVGTGGATGTSLQSGAAGNTSTQAGTATTAPGAAGAASSAASAGGTPSAANALAGGAASGAVNTPAGTGTPAPGAASTSAGGAASGMVNTPAGTGAPAPGAASAPAGGATSGAVSTPAGTVTLAPGAASASTSGAGSGAGITPAGTGTPAPGAGSPSVGSTSPGAVTTPAGNGIPATGAASASAGGAATTAHGTANTSASGTVPGTATTQSASPATANPRSVAAANAAHFPGNNQAAPSASTLSTPTRTNLELLLHVTTQMLQGADNTAQQAGQLADKAKQLGLNFEEQLAHALRRLPPDSDTAQIRHTFQHALQSAAEQGTTLKHALLLTQAAAAELDAAGLGSLQQDLSTVLKNVTGQQLMQTSGGDRADLLYQFAAVPVRHGKDEQTVELHVMARKSHGQKTIDPANCYVLFRLDMPNLGELDIHLHIVDKVVGVRFLSEKHADMAVTPADQRDLRDALQKVGFHLGVLKVEDKKQQEPGAAEPLLPPILTHKQFDLKI